MSCNTLCHIPIQTRIKQKECVSALKRPFCCKLLLLKSHRTQKLKTRAQQKENDDVPTKKIDEAMFSKDYDKEKSDYKKQKKNYFEEGEKTAEHLVKILADIQEMEQNNPKYIHKLNLLMQRAASKYEFMPPSALTQIVQLGHRRWNTNLKDQNYRHLVSRWIDRIQKQVNFLTVDEIMDAFIMSCKVEREFWQSSCDFMMERLGSRLGEVDKVKLTKMIQGVTK
eukprot:TRINITY_DN7147_c0_g4_i2.p1 TRINITY_DN7147_c0_g4~~TRINITY_DN7147_c0_g4_i2.p1  ORF type:complete len:225 (+),score=22.58 TRINITY_DN7147_c0_g4_i2:107-781(+)